MNPNYKSVALVDLSYLFKKAWHGQPHDAQPGHAANVALAQLAGARESVDHVIVCLDSPPYRRKDIDPGYKSRREKPSDEELSQKRWLLERIEKDGYSIARAKGYEADDLIGALCLRYAWIGDVRIIASDKDLAQCVAENVRMFVPPVGDRPGEVRGPKEILAKYGVSPKDMGLWLALCGDDSDDIPGVPGIGPKKAAQIINQCGSLVGIAEAVAAPDTKPSKMWEALAANWERLVMSVKLTTLETDAPVDAEGLLVKKEPERLMEDEGMTEESTDDGRSETPEEWQARKAHDDSAPVAPARAAPTDAEWDPISRAPQGYVAPSLERYKPLPPSAPKTEPAAIVAAKDEYGAVTEDLQPVDLKSARNISKWAYNGRLYPQFPTAESVFTIIARGKELGIGWTTALAGFHLIEGKPSASADLIRSLAERHPDCEYFMLAESTPEKATWETKHRKHPRPTTYTYTIEEAKRAGLNNGNWQKRPRDMLAKTAGSKLARIVYPAAVIGLYAPEELEQ